MNGGGVKPNGELGAKTRAEAATRLRHIAAAICPGQPVKTQIECVANALGWPFHRTRALWYGRVDVLAFEMDRLRTYPQER